ncbi:hypothetical protein G3480_18150 [Thiorhodococcus mannitoliphagus]|uniref:Uncharacterized protein n=1 Tax=Thiorhodococcus mannitoliphagus TaxID=329406 RepID=A0A6P1DYP1_9GAMM|nr:hypothetical protein [Thiorhodococcus mannitoliphagus]
MLPPIDISSIADRLNEIGDDLEQAYDEVADADGPEPRVLLDGMQRLLDIMRAADAGLPAKFPERIQEATGSDPEVLLDHGLRLLAQLSDLATQLDLPRHAEQMEQLGLPLCCWLLRRGAELKHPEPVVNAAAHIANGLHTTDELVELFGLLNEVMSGIGIERALELESNHPERPWRVLLLNRAIVATRSRQPVLMEEAFQSVVEHLREDAPDFFREGMGQMEALDYPVQVREVMQRYFDVWCVGQKLH